MDAPSVVPDVEFHIDQRFGRAKDGVGRGSTRPWLGTVDPLREAWLEGLPSMESAAPTADQAPPPSAPLRPPPRTMT